jgi:hypothetical protein
MSKRPSNLRSASVRVAHHPTEEEPRRPHLLLTVPYTLYKGDGGRGTPGSVNVRVNLSDKGSVKIER